MPKKSKKEKVKKEDVKKIVSIGDNFKEFKEEILAIKPLEEEKPKKESLKIRIAKRKEHLKEAFLKCLKKHNPDSKFNYNSYIRGTGGKGFLCDALKDFNINDRKIFQEILQELKEDKTLYHIGGSMYVLQ